MKCKYMYFLFLGALFSIACTRQSSASLNDQDSIRIFEEFEYPFIQSKGKTLANFVPFLWEVADTIYEDLNNDGKTDALLILTYADTLDSYEHPKGVVSYWIYERRILLILFKDKNEYTRNTYCYKLLNFNGGIDRRNIKIVAKSGMLFMSFQTVGNGMYALYYTFESEYKTKRWVLTNVHDEGGNSEYDMRSSYNFENDSLHYYVSHWNNNEEDTTWTEYHTDVDTVLHIEKRYYLDSMENGEATPAFFLPETSYKEGE